MKYFEKDYSEIQDGIFTDWRNYGTEKGIEVDTSKYSLVYVFSCVLAAVMWGFYKTLDYIAVIPFPDLCDTYWLNRHASLRDLTRQTGETDSELAARVLERWRHPPTGGNKYDYEDWALENPNVKYALCIRVARGLGTVDVVIVANTETTGDELPSTHTRTGQSTSVVEGKLYDLAADFDNAAFPVAVGDIVCNRTSGAKTSVTAVDGANQLSLQDDIFIVEYHDYSIYLTGTVTTLTEDKLVDSAADFDSEDATVKPGDIVRNESAGTETSVLSVDSATQLTLEDDIFTGVGQTYTIESLTGQVLANIDNKRVVSGKDVRIMGPTILTEDVTASVEGPCDLVQYKADIESYMNSRQAGDKLSVKFMEAMAFNNGATDVIISVPAADVVTSQYEIVRPGVISVG